MHKQTKIFCIGLHKNKYLVIEAKLIFEVSIISIASYA